MTNPFTPINQNTDRLNIAQRGNQPMIVKVWDAPEYVRTPHNKDGMVRIDGREPFPNRAVRALVVDLTAIGEDGQPGKVYPETWFQASSMMKTMKGWVGQLKLITWLQDAEPKDQYGNPRQTNPYTITDHTGNQHAMTMAMEYLERHPEVLDIPAPAPYDGKPPAPEQGPPTGYYQSPQWNQQSPQQWQPPVQPQQPPSQWNTAAPPPGYYQQPPQQPDPWAGQPGYQQPPQQASAPPAPPYQGQGYQQAPQAPQGAPGSFFQAAAGQQGPPQPPQQYLPGPVNHHGQPQDYPPPF